MVGDFWNSRYLVRKVRLTPIFGRKNGQNGRFQIKMTEKLRKLKISKIPCLFLLKLLQTWFWPIFAVFVWFWQHFYSFEENGIFLKNHHFSSFLLEKRPIFYNFSQFHKFFFVLIIIPCKAMISVILGIIGTILVEL